MSGEPPQSPSHEPPYGAPHIASLASNDPEIEPLPNPWPTLTPEEEAEVAQWNDHLDELETRATGSRHTSGSNGRIRLLPEVTLGVDVHRVLDQAVKAFALDPLLFQRAHELVGVIGVDEDGRTPLNGNGCAVSCCTPILRTHNVPSVLPRVTRHLQFMAYKRPTKGQLQLEAQGGPPVRPEPVAVQPPPNILGSMLALGSFQEVREIVGITESPVVRPDGTIHQDAGWDPTTKYLFLPPYPYPHIDKAPSQTMARDALAQLIEPFAEMPFVSTEARFVPIAAILTALARPAIQGAIPGFVFDASTRGSGKTLQADVISLIVTGHAAARAHYPTEDEELHKTLASIALAGTPLFLLDNVTRQLGGGSLELVLTAREEVEFRILGKSEMRRLPWRCLVMASGNNITLTEDTLRRVLVSRLEPSEEHPEDRENFTHSDLPAWVLAERPRLVACALTILRAYFFDHCPHAGPRSWGSFEAWSRLVPHAICFAGGPDVLATRPRWEQAANDELSDLAVLLAGLPRLSPHPMTCREIIDAIYPVPRADEPPDGHDDLRDAIEGMTRTRPGFTPPTKALGYALRRHMGRVLQGKRLLRTSPSTTHGNTARWSVE